MRVLVTGSSGFIGGYVLEELRFRGHKPVPFDVKRNVFEDVRRLASLDIAGKHVDGVIHLAAVLGTQETVNDPRPAIRTNLEGSANVMELCVRRDIPLVVICTGNAWMRDQGAGAYPITKEAAQDLAVMYRQHRGLRVNSIRPVNAYGPRQSVAKPYGDSDVRKIIPSFITRALCGDDIEIYGDGEQVSDIVWVGDVAEALVTALECAAVGWILPTVSVGPTQHLTVNGIAQRVRVHTGLRSDTVHLPMRPGEIPGRTQASNEHRFIPQRGAYLSTDEGLKKTVAWYAMTKGSFWKNPADA